MAADEPSGSTQGALGQRRQALDVNAHVLGGKLEVSFTYSQALHQRLTVETLAQRYLQALRALVGQRRSEDAARFSLADFPLARLTQATLDELVRASPTLVDLYPLSPMQQGMLFHSLLDPGSGRVLRAGGVDAGHRAGPDGAASRLAADHRALPHPAHPLRLGGDGRAAPGGAARGARCPGRSRTGEACPRRSSKPGSRSG